LDQACSNKRAKRDLVRSGGCDFCAAQTTVGHFVAETGTIAPAGRCAPVNEPQPSAADRGGTVIHPLQLASAMLVFMFATWLFAGMQFFSQQQLSKQRVRPVIQIAALPM
jgi:hypothetical protein